MKIDGKNYDLNKVAESVSLNQITKDENLSNKVLFNNIFDNLSVLLVFC